MEYNEFRSYCVLFILLDHIKHKAQDAEWTIFL